MLRIDIEFRELKYFPLFLVETCARRSTDATIWSMVSDSTSFLFRIYMIHLVLLSRSLSSSNQRWKTKHVRHDPNWKNPANSWVRTSANEGESRRERTDTVTLNSSRYRSPSPSTVCIRTYMLSSHLPRPNLLPSKQPLHRNALTHPYPSHIRSNPKYTIASSQPLEQTRIEVLVRTALHYQLPTGLEHCTAKPEPCISSSLSFFRSIDLQATYPVPVHV